MPKILIQDFTFERLQSVATPLIDTADSVINRALDALVSQGSQVDPDPERAIPNCEIDPDNLPDVTHSRVLSAQIDGKFVPTPNWNLLQEEALERAMKRFNDFDQVSRLSQTNIVRGRKEIHGYRYVPDLGISIQGSSAQTAFKTLVSVARELAIGIEIALAWPGGEGGTDSDKQTNLILSGGQR